MLDSVAALCRAEGPGSYMAPVFRPPRKGCAVRLMRVGLALPILAARLGGPLCAYRVLVRSSLLIGRASFHRHPVSSGAAFALRAGPMP